MRARSRAVVLAMLVVACAHPLPGEAGCKDCPPFPVPRAEAEFRELLDVPRGFASGGAVSLEEIFLNLMPYGPLDLQVTGAATHDEISTLKNYYFGSVCRILGVDPDRLTVVFNCGKGCVEKRRDQIRGNLDSWSEVAARFEAAAGVRLVGAWGAPVAFRVNDVLKAGDQVFVAAPSSVMGFIPGGRFSPKASLAEALAERSLRVDQVENLITSMTKVGAVAVRYRVAGGVEVIQLGIADNLSGVLFLSEGVEPPAERADHENGSSYVLVEKLAKDVYFFETR
ncbi:MAG: hypothetical protein KBF21_06930 [Thermoanaerobaculia bacterium]|nr:hypothetical protein [Thermoanaerobaculia bacterium]MBP9823940.1 hypothetical protein [Thermoanaerobaculia bacterium]